MKSKHAHSVANSLLAHGRNDSALSVFAAKQLTLLETNVHEKIEEDLTYDQVIPMSFEGGAGLDSITSTWGEETGVAAQVGNSGTDFPRVNIGENEVVFPVKDYGIEYAVTIRDIEKALRANKNVSSKLALAANRGMEIAVNKAMFHGDGKLKGILSDLTVLSSYTLPGDGDNTGGKNPKQLRNKLADKVERDLVAMWNIATAVYNGRFPIDTLALAPLDYNHIVTKKSSIGSDMLIFDYLKKIGIKNIVASPDLEKAGGVLMLSKNNDVLEGVIPDPKRALPAFFNGWEFITKYVFSCSGVHLYHPKKVIFAAY